jgi:dipeptidyl aminopeptidase/acylaminoacyl peptidase
MGNDVVPLVPRKVLFGNPERYLPKISPDGQTLAYLAPSHGVLNVWVRAPGGQADRVVTHETKRDIHLFFWQQDSAHILYLQDKGGDENDHLFQADFATGATWDLTPFPGVKVTLVSDSPEHPDQLLVGLNRRDPRVHDVYRIDLKSREVALDTENPGDVGSWIADNAMQVRVAQALRPDGGVDIRIRENAQSPWRPFRSWGPDESFGGVQGFTADNRAVRLISSVDANAARLLEVDLATGQATVQFEDAEYDVGGILEHSRTHRLEAIHFYRARREWVVIDPGIQADFEAIQAVHDGDFNIVSSDLNETVWIVSYVLDDGPLTYYRYDRATRQSTLLFTSQPALEAYSLAKIQAISYTARDGMTLYGYLTLPLGVEPQNLPLILLVHGGPWARDTWGMNPQAQWLANRGYAVLQINFRGSTGYGKRYLNAGDREWAGTMHDDLLDGKKWAIDQGYADPQRVAIMGGSYGGYATLVGLTFTPDAFVCGVDIVGPSNLISLIKTIPPYWAPLRAIFDKRLGKLETDEEFLRSRSPLFKADQIKAPLLIAQGANDPRVKQSESDQIVEAMRKNSQPVEYLVFPDEGHGFVRPENRFKFFAAAEAFLAKYLGGRAEPPSEEERADDLRR